MTDIAIPPPERIKADVEHIKEWLSQEPHLAHIAMEEDEEWLETFLYNNKFSLEKTKHKLENLYSLRSKYPEIFKNRNPSGEDFIQASNYYTHVFGDKLTKDGMQVIMNRYEEGSGGCDATSYLKYLFMAYDLAMLDKNNRLAKFITIVDCQNFKMEHIIKLMPVAGLVGEIADKAYSLRATAIHIINLPNFAQKFLETVVKLFPDKLNERLQVHGSKKALLEAVDENVVCSDFGGKGPSIAELQVKIQRKLEESRGWFKNQGTLCSNEELRPKDFKQLEEMRGSFRKLAVD